MIDVCFAAVRQLRIVLKTTNTRHVIRITFTYVRGLQFYTFFSTLTTGKLELKLVRWGSSHILLQFQIVADSRSDRLGRGTGGQGHCIDPIASSTRRL